MVELIEGQAVVCDLTGERTHERRVGWCYQDGRDIAADLIRASLARIVRGSVVGDMPQMTSRRQKRCQFRATAYRVRHSPEPCRLLEKMVGQQPFGLQGVQCAFPSD
jgi:hypothetical protein